MISREWNGTYSMILILVVTHDYSECMHVASLSKAHRVLERLRPFRYLTARSRTVVHAFAARGKPSPSYINPFPQHFLQISSFNLLMRAERALPRKSYLGVIEVLRWEKGSIRTAMSTPLQRVSQFTCSALFPFFTRRRPEVLGGTADPNATLGGC